MNPVNEEDFHAWYNEEHLDMIHGVPGHRRSQRYVIEHRHHDPGALNSIPKHLAIHEFESLDAYQSNAEEAVAAKSSPWTRKNFMESTINVFRSFRLVRSVGS